MKRRRVVLTASPNSQILNPINPESLELTEKGQDFPEIPSAKIL